MTWTISDKSQRIKRYGSRVIKRFALFPVRAGNEVKWLETYYILQRFYSLWHEIGWENIKFVTQQDYCDFESKIKNLI